MPLVTAAVIVYAAGLLSGFGGALAYTLGAAALVVWTGGRRAPERWALAAIAAAGFCVAAGARYADTACQAKLRGASQWRVTLDADATPGSFVTARHACAMRFTLAVARGEAAAGAEVLARGQVGPSRLGLVVTNAAIHMVRPPGMLARWRSAIGQGIDARFGSDAPLVRALLIADMRELSPTVRDRFAAAGLSHMLSVSGLHVGLIAVAVSLVGSLVGLAKRRGDALVIGLTVAYVAVIGAPLPAVRAAAMLAILSLSTAIQRPTSAWAVLAVGAMLPLLDSRAVLDVGYQLSVVGMVALVAAGALGRRWSWLAVGGWRGTLRRGIAASTIATALTAPLVAATFGRISLVAPVSNLVAVPIMSALQPMLFLAALLLPLPTAAQFVADACHPLLVAIDAIASWASHLPGASLTVVTDQISLALACAAAAALVVAAVSRFPGRALVLAAACLAALAWRPFAPARGGLTELHMLDVGQGDALALRTARGHWVLFDAGRDWRGGDEGQRDVVPYVAARGGAGKVVAFVLSHPHSDHVGGASSTLRALAPRWYFDPGYAGGTSSYRASLLAARDVGVRWRRVRPGDSLVVDEAVITFLAPDSAWAEAQHDPNLASSIARIRVGDVTMLMTGDAEAPEEEWVMAHAGEALRADVLKVAHHGSKTSSTARFLSAVQPRLALISVGTANVYRHPSPSVLESLALRGVITLRTDLHGNVVLRTDGTIIDVETATDRWRLDPRPK